jgi:hypothetical protein
MGRIGKLLLCVFAVAALAATTAASASAQPPEYGRCIAKAVKGGPGYTSSKCTVATATKGKYEWLAGPGPQAGFVSEAKIVYSHDYKTCRTALFEEELAKKERVEAEGASEPLKAELIEKAVEHETNASDYYRRAEKTRKDCETLVEKEEGKAPVKLATTGRTRLACAAEAGTGEYVSATEVGNVTFRLSECAKKQQACQTEGAGEGEIITAALSGRLGVVSDEKGKVKAGLDLQSASAGAFAEFSCGATTFVLSGSVVHGVTANRMAKVELRDFRQKDGHEIPDGFLGEPDFLEAAIGGAAPEAIGLEIKDEQISEEKIEVNTAV